MTKTAIFTHPGHGTFDLSLPHLLALRAFITEFASDKTHVLDMLNRVIAEWSVTTDIDPAVRVFSLAEHLEMWTAVTALSHPEPCECGENCTQADAERRFDPDLFDPCGNCVYDPAKCGNCMRLEMWLAL